MDYRVLGASGVKVSTLCLGTMMFGGPTEEDEARRMVDRAFDLGVNFIDTANRYTGGRSEEVTGRAIGARRDKWVLATKVGNPGSDAPLDQGLSRRHIFQSIDESLSRLGTDYVDIFYAHLSDPDTPWEETVAAFADLIKAGKTRYIGLSNTRAWEIAHVAHIFGSMGAPPPVVCQPYYNLLNRQPEVDVIPACEAFGLGVVPYSPIARGVLTGKYKVGEAPAADTRAGRSDTRMMETEFRDESFAVAEKIQAHAAKRNASSVDFAVAWVLANGAVTSVITGPRTFEQWESYASALYYEWTAEDEALVDNLVPAGHTSTPGYTDPKYPIEGRFPVV